MLRSTACPLDCPDTCTLTATVDDGRVSGLGAGEGNPITGGFICKKVKGYAAHVYAPERISTPLLRTGPKGAGSFIPISWDEALDRVAAQVRQAADLHGPEAVVPFLYHSSAPSLTDVLPARLWQRFGASRVAHTICARTFSLAYHATFDGMLSADPRDAAHARVVVVWGANPAVTNTHLLPYITAAQRAGARLVVVDPRRTGIAKRADLHLAPRPGTDTALALGLATELVRIDGIDRAFLEAHVDGADELLAAAAPWTAARAAAECDLEADDVRAFARLLASGGPVFTRVGWGLERHQSGGSACAAVMALPVLTGQFGRPGSGVMASLSAGSRPGVPSPTGSVPGTGGAADAEPRTFNMNTFGAALCDPALHPPISVLFVAGSNLAATNPRQTEVLRGLAREDLFTVVHDHVLTDTARFADVVLPAPTHLEVADLAHSYGSYMLQAVEPVIDRVGEARTDNEVAAALAVRLGFSSEQFDPDPQRLRAASLAAPTGPDQVGETRADGTTVQLRDTWPAGGRLRLASLPGLGVPRYEPRHSAAPSRPSLLTLLTPATPKTINSMLGEVDPASPAIRLHPEDAAARGINDGDRVVVRNDLAAVTTVATIDPDTRRGVAWMPKGLWCRQLEGGLTANALVPDTLSDLGDGACFNDARVEVARA